MSKLKSSIGVASAFEHESVNRSNMGGYIRIDEQQNAEDAENFFLTKVNLEGGDTLKVAKGQSK